MKLLLLLPAWIYGAVVNIRNFLYNSNILKSTDFDKPVIVVGNITVGGTGKTPHTEYITNFLKNNYRVAVLSRGYKRKTKGYRQVNYNDSYKQVGDEPLQIKRKFGDNVFVAVSEDRVEGINKILKQNQETDILILDDAFQHRRVKPTVSVLLINYNKPIFADHYLPYGRLRESRHEAERANIIVVTKCPENIKPIERRIFAKNINLMPYQTIFFTTIDYGQLINVFNNNKEEKYNNNLNVLLVTGIAETENLEKYIKSRFNGEFEHLKFQDHRDFKKKDIEKIVKKFNKLSDNKIIITTEKDAIRIKENKFFPDSLKEKIFYLPIKIKFLFNEEEIFNKQILEYVRNNKRNYRLHTTKRQL